MPQRETSSLQLFLGPGPTGETCPERLTRQASKSLFEFEIWIQEEQTGSVLCPATPDVSPLPPTAALERPPASMRSGRVAMLANSGCLRVSIAEAGVHSSFDFVNLIQTEGGGGDCICSPGFGTAPPPAGPRGLFKVRRRRRIC